MRSFLSCVIISITCSLQYPYTLVRYNHREYINTIQPLIQYTHVKMRESKMYPQLKAEWKKHNVNMHKGLHYAKRKQDKSVYVGWKDTINDEFSDIEEYVSCDCTNIPDIFMTLEVSDNQTVKLINIITNPSHEVSLEKLKFALMDVRKSGVCIDLTYIRNHYNSRVYLELHVD